MSERFEQLAARRKRLLLRSAAQRGELARISQDIGEDLARIDRSLSAMRAFVRHPAVIAGAFAALAIIGPRRVLGFASRAAPFLNSLRERFNAPRGCDAAARLRGGG
ncbi:MAG TPA: YqjK-like family protein [Steroidobacter sp.]|nr:YqjK-like family protein [Steroidobacter sp.]